MSQPTLLALLLVAASTASPRSFDGPDPRFTPQAEKQAEELSKRIRSEIERLGGAHAWSGSYYEGDGLGSNITIHLAPENGFVLHETGCLGVYDRDFGSVRAAQDEIVFASKLQTDGKEGAKAARVLVPITWGERRYLIPPDGFPGFCDDANTGREPRSGPFGMHLLRKGDEAKPASGLPSVPERYRHLLLKEPIVATVTKVVGRSIDKYGAARFLVELDVGKEAGLRAGMQMCLVQPNRFSPPAHPRDREGFRQDRRRTAGTRGFSARSRVAIHDQDLEAVGTIACLRGFLADRGFPPASASPPATPPP